jgi:hypothetical protein
VLKENKNLSKNDRMLREENKRLLELVENTADRIQNMENLIQAQKR